LIFGQQLYSKFYRLGVPRNNPLPYHQPFEFVMMFLKRTRQVPMDNSPMKAIELIGDIDEQHRLQARVPEGVPAGPVRLIVLIPEEDEAGVAWTQGIGKEWADELRDARQDIYTPQDGQPVNAPR
jgi:hypothetical protein